MSEWLQVCGSSGPQPPLAYYSPGAVAAARASPTHTCRCAACPAEELVVATRASKPSTPEEEALAAQIQLHESWAAGARSSAGSSQWRGPELLQAYDR